MFLTIVDRQQKGLHVERLIGEGTHDGTVSVVSICAVSHAVPSWRIANVDCRQPRAVIFITLLQLPFTINF